MKAPERGSANNAHLPRNAGTTRLCPFSPLRATVIAPDIFKKLPFIKLWAAAPLAQQPIQTVDQSKGFRQFDESFRPLF
ncbi:MAG: hypothetical protein MR379_02160 [Clostridiales bacterium]|nr:hypothetical protein [Clostridiales bacterium]